MKLRYWLCLLLLISGINDLFSQQNLFNIPSGDITEKGKIFYQHQLNVYQSRLESKAHFVYGLGDGWDAGLNLVGKGFYFTPDWRLLHNDNPDKGALYPILMGTVQKQFSPLEKLDLNTGLQAGINLSNRIDNKELNFFWYGLAIWHFKKGSRITGGVYHSNQMFIGQGNDTGWMIGYEYKLSKRWYLMGDWISGNNDAAVAVIGGMFNASKRVQICAGWQIPNPNTPKPAGLVLEINLLGWDLY
jgi:hypothetical protein